MKGTKGPPGTSKAQTQNQRPQGKETSKRSHRPRPVDHSLSDSVLAASRNVPVPVKPIVVKPDSEKAWVLGKSYDLSDEREAQAFSHHVSSFLRFTYRRDFPPLHPYPITSDSGWGCMLRAAQMLLGHTLLRHLLGEDWRIPRAQRAQSLSRLSSYQTVLRSFLDYPGKPYLFSIHHLVQAGMRYDKLPGEWFGPSTVSLVLRDLCRVYRQRLKGTLSVHVSSGDVVYLSEIEELCRDTRLSQCLLGYTSPLDTEGGRPNHAIYFIGYEKETLYGLDPHTTYGTESLTHVPQTEVIAERGEEERDRDRDRDRDREREREKIKARESLSSEYVAVSPSKDSLLSSSEDTFPSTSLCDQLHVSRPVSLSFTQLDPSLSLGFYFRDRESLSLFAEQVRRETERRLLEHREVLFQIQSAPPLYVQREREREQRQQRDWDEEDDEDREADHKGTEESETEREKKEKERKERLRQHWSVLGLTEDNRGREEAEREAGDDPRDEDYEFV